MTVSEEASWTTATSCLPEHQKFYCAVSSRYWTLPLALRKFEYTSSLLRELHSLRVPERRPIKLRLCVLRYSCLHGEAPSYLAETIHPVFSCSTRKKTKKNIEQSWVSPWRQSRSDGSTWCRSLDSLRRPHSDKPGFHYPNWRVTGFHYPSTRPVLTGNGNRSPVNSCSGNRALHKP